MKLSELIKVGAFIDEGVTSKTVKWDGHEFDVLVKNEMSASDFEFVYGVGVNKHEVNDSDESYAARRIHRFIRLDGGTEPVSYEDAVRMKSSLVIALAQAINEVHGETGKKKN